MSTATELTSEQVAAFRVAAWRRHEREQKELMLREERAWMLAHRTAALVREQFDAQRVALFGSLVHEGCFTQWSDVDIAVWGIRAEDTLRAIGAAMDLDGKIEVNLVDAATCSISLLATIEQEGIGL